MNPSKNSNITSYFVSRKRFGRNYSSKYSKKQKATQGNSKYNYTECRLTRSEINTAPPSENSIIFDKSFSEPSTDDLTLAKKPTENSSNLQEKRSELSNSANNVKGFEMNIYKKIDSERSRKVQNYSSKNNNVTSQDFFSGLTPLLHSISENSMIKKSLSVDNEEIGNKGEENNYAKLSTVSHFQPKRLDNGEFKELLFDVENLISDPRSHTKTQCDDRKMRNNFLFKSSELSINNIGSAEIIELNPKSKFHYKGKTKNKLGNSNGKKVSGILNQNKITDFFTCCKKSSNQNDTQDFSSSRKLNSKITLNGFAGENRYYSSDYQYSISSSKGTLMNSKSKSTNFKHRRKNNKIIVSRTITKFLTPVKISSDQNLAKYCRGKYSKTRSSHRLIRKLSNDISEDCEVYFFENTKNMPSTTRDSNTLVSAMDEMDNVDAAHVNDIEDISEYSFETRLEESDERSSNAIYNIHDQKKYIQKNEARDWSNNSEKMCGKTDNRIETLNVSDMRLEPMNGVCFDEISDLNCKEVVNINEKDGSIYSLNDEYHYKTSSQNIGEIIESNRSKCNQNVPKHSKPRDEAAIWKSSFHHLHGEHEYSKGISNSDVDELHYSDFKRLLNDSSKKTETEKASNVTIRTINNSSTQNCSIFNSTISHSPNIGPQINKKAKLHRVPEFYGGESNTGFEEMMRLLVNLSGNHATQGTSKVTINEPKDIEKFNCDCDKSHPNIMKLLNDWSEEYKTEETTNVNIETITKNSGAKEFSIYNSSNIGPPNSNIKESKSQDVLAFSAHEANTGFEETLELLVNLSGNRTAQRTSKETINEPKEIEKSNFDFDKSHSKIMKLLNDWSEEYKTEETTNVNIETMNKNSGAKEFRIYNSPNMAPPNSNIKESKSHGLEFSVYEVNTGFEETLELFVNLSGNRTAHRTSKATINEATEIGISNSDFDESHSKIMKLLNDWSEKSTTEVTSNVTTATMNKISPTRDSRMSNCTINHSPNMDQQNNNIKKSFSCDESNSGFEEIMGLVNLSGNFTGRSKVTIDGATAIGKPKSDFDESHSEIMKLLNDWSEKSKTAVTSNVTIGTMKQTRDSKSFNTTINHSPKMGSQNNNMKKSKLYEVLEFSGDESNTDFEEIMELLANLSGNRIAQATSKATEIGKSIPDFDESHSKIMKLLNDWSEKSTAEETSNETIEIMNTNSATTDCSIFNSFVNHLPNMGPQNSNIKKSIGHGVLELSVHESNSGFEEMMELLVNISGNRTAQGTLNVTVNEATEIAATANLTSYDSTIDHPQDIDEIVGKSTSYYYDPLLSILNDDRIEGNQKKPDDLLQGELSEHLMMLMTDSNVCDHLSKTGDFPKDIDSSNVGHINEVNDQPIHAVLHSENTLTDFDNMDIDCEKKSSEMFSLSNDEVERKKQETLTMTGNEKNLVDDLSDNLLCQILNTNIISNVDKFEPPIYPLRKSSSQDSVSTIYELNFPMKERSKVEPIYNEELLEQMFDVTESKLEECEDEVDPKYPLKLPIFDFNSLLIDNDCAKAEDPLSEHKLEENESDLLDLFESPVNDLFTRAQSTQTFATKYNVEHFSRNVEKQTAECVKDLADLETENSLFSSGCQYSNISQKECIAQKNIMFNELLCKTMAANKRFIIKNLCENVDGRDIKKVQVQKCGKFKIYTIVKTEICETDLTVNEDNLEQENADDIFKNTELNGGTHNGVFIYSNIGDKEADEKLLRAFNRVGTDKSLLYDRNNFGTHNPQINKMDIITKIQKIFSKVRDDFSQGGTSSLKLRQQRLENCNFHDDRLQLKPIGEAKMVIVNYSSVASQPKFCLMMYILEKVMELLDNNSKITKREIFYQIKNIIGFQCIVDRAINAVSCMLNVGPWSLNIIAQKGLVYGNLRLTSSSNEVINCNVPGTLIPQDVDGIVKFESEAYFILVVEKESIFHKLLDENLPNRLIKPFIMITGKGFPDLNTQLFLKKLWMIMSIPVFILVDADPHGISIMINYRFGSLKHAHLSHYLAVPKAKWLGVFPSEITKMNIMRQSMSERERNVARNLLKAPYMMGNPKIAEEINVLLERNVKAGIEGLIKNDKFLSDFYFPVKFYNQDYI